MQIIEKKLTELKEYEKNPRRNDQAVDAVAASIREFGFKVPIIIDRDGVIVAGHTRLKAARKLGLETVPCIIADDLSPEQIQAFRLADNKTAELAEWDPDLLLQELGQITIDMEQFGFQMDEEPEDPDDLKEDEYEEPDRMKSRAKYGDVWRLGDHILVCGDSSNEEDIKKLLSGPDKPKMIFTDPPYGVAIGDKNKMLQSIQKAGRIVENIENDAIGKDDLYQILVKAFSLLKKYAAPDASYYVSSPQGGDLCLMMMMMRDAGLPVRHLLIWVKNNATFSLGRLDYDYRHEPIFYTWAEKHNFYGGYSDSVIDDTKPLEKMTKEELKEMVHALRDKKETSVIYCDRPMAAPLHPTMKPVKLVGRFIINSSREGDMVADIFGGSGTTMIAAEQLGRKCRMMEMDPHYCDVIIDRWETFTGRKAERIDGQV